MPEFDQIKALHERYRQSLNGKADSLDSLINEITVSAPSTKASQTKQKALLDELRDWLHKVAGSSGMYGYNEINTKSRALMTDLQASEMTMSNSLENRLLEFSRLLRAEGKLK